jgi:hypothetical protein
VCLRSVGSGGMDHDGNCLTMLKSDYCSVTGKRSKLPIRRDGQIEPIHHAIMEYHGTVEVQFLRYYEIELYTLLVP